MACNVERVRATIECSKRRRDILGSAHVRWRDLEPKRVGRRLSLLCLAFGSNSDGMLRDR